MTAARSSSPAPSSATALAGPGLGVNGSGQLFVVYGTVGGLATVTSNGVQDSAARSDHKHDGRLSTVFGLNSNALGVTSATGSLALSNSADSTDLLSLSRTFAGAGTGLAVSMGATTTGNGLDVDMVSGSTGRGLRLHQGATDYWLFGATGSLAATPASGQAITMTTTAAALTLVGPSTSSIAIGSSGQITVITSTTQALTLNGAASSSIVSSSAGLVSITAAQGQELQFKDAAARATTSGTTNFLISTPRFTPGSGSASWAAHHLNPTINGTSSGTATALAIASKTNTLTGGTVWLLDVGTTSTDYFTGYSQNLAVSPTTPANDDTVLLLRYKPGAGAATVQRVTVGATDSGGTGFRVLRVPN